MLANFSKSVLKRLLPGAVIIRCQLMRLRLARAANARRPIREVFRDVYTRNQWGGVRGDFHSGPGSEEGQAKAYAAAVREFVRQHCIKTVVDLGCGDYRVGQMLKVPGVHYIGVDLVPELIERNRTIFTGPETEFLCRDLLEDDLPNGELCLLRQVLQHLSNHEIARALERLGQYPYVLVTEHYPAPGYLVGPNLDKPHGPDTRVVDGSGVFLDLPPFSRPVRGIILEAPVASPIAHRGETLRTVLLTGPEPGP